MPGLDYELSLLSELVAIDTDTTKKTGYTECAELITRRMTELGMGVEILDPVDKVGDGLKRPNVVGTFDVGAKETLGLVVHYDVVPPGENWKRDPFKLVIEDGKAYGRGSSDDKSAIAASMGAVRAVGKKSRFNIKIIASPEEEIGGRWGIGYVMRDAGLKFDCGIIVDDMPDIISIGACGIIFGEIKVFGKQGHAGYPHRADNPVPKLVETIGAFDEFARRREQKVSKADAPPGSPRQKVWGRVSFTMLGGGEKENIIPSEAWTRFDMRLLPEENPEEGVAELKAFFEDLKRRKGLNARLTINQDEGGYLTDPSDPLVRRFAEASTAVFGARLPIAASLGGDDGHYLYEQGIPVISYGAIAEDSNFHGKDEFVRLSDLQNVRDVLVRFIG
jgi:succinyl-diaminopimelate desuccinylase